MTVLEGKRVLVVGGSSGIGRAVAEQALAEGAQVTIASRSSGKLETAAAELGEGVETAVLDIRDFGAVEAFCAERSWDHVAVSAAETPTGPVRLLPMEDARQAMESKFWGAYHVARAARIVERGSLTLVSGAWSVRPSASAVLQGAINAAIEGLARGLALEFSPTRVNTVSPGLIDTPIWSHLDEAARSAVFEAAAASLPAKTVGLPSDVANAVLFLMKTPYASGTTVRVDGGGSIG